MKCHYTEQGRCSASEHDKELFPKVFSGFEQELGFFCSSEIDGNLIFNDFSEFQNQCIKKKIPKNMVWCGQSHQDECFVADAKICFYQTADAIITQEKNLPLLIRTADCIPVFVFDPVTKTIANIHAGWRGQSKKIVTKTIQTMIKNFQVSPKNLLVFAGPSLGKNHAIFSDPKNELDAWLHPFIQKNNAVDLKSALQFELESLGIPPEQIEISPICTFKENALPSWRREKSMNRISNILWLK